MKTWHWVIIVIAIAIILLFIYFMGVGKGVVKGAQLTDEQKCGARPLGPSQFDCKQQQNGNWEWVVRT